MVGSLSSFFFFYSSGIFAPLLTYNKIFLFFPLRCISCTQHLLALHDRVGEGRRMGRQAIVPTDALLWCYSSMFVVPASPASHFGTRIAGSCLCSTTKLTASAAATLKWLTCEAPGTCNAGASQDRCPCSPSCKSSSLPRPS